MTGPGADLLIRDARPMGGERADVLIRDGRVARIAPGIVADGVPEEDANGAVALPGFVDAHTHLDKTLMGRGWHVNNVGADLMRMIENERRLRADPAIDPHVQSMRHATALIATGTSLIRSHVDIDTDNGLRMVEGVLATREALRGEVEIEIVAFPQSGLVVRPGTLALLEEALRMGADLVGGLDPCGIDRDPKASLDAVFDLAGRFGRPIDIHLHEAGDLGAFTAALICERTRALGMQGRVTISHAFYLGLRDHVRVGRMIDELAELDVAIVTTGAPSRDIPPLTRLLDAGVRVGAGCDGVRDAWKPSARPDMRDRARIICMKQDLRADDELELAVRLVTTESARVLGRDDHRLVEGAVADLVLLDVETLAEVAMDASPARLVVKGGRVVARDGAALAAAP
ncbi:MAG: amidohydrolase family protein [Microvirga sp.]|nr:amidohydrolase family protein [Microvirga sp.]